MTNKTFNTEGVCVPRLHYMVDTSAMIEQIAREFVEPGKYFVINRARQFGKTTTLQALHDKLNEEYTVIGISFEGSDKQFVSQQVFVRGLLLQFSDELAGKPITLPTIEIDSELPMRCLDSYITSICESSDERVILLIDEVDKASSYEVFIAFLGLLRTKYLAKRHKGENSTFHSVILAGVHDIKNLKAKIRPDSEHAYNSPWNIAAQFDIDMSFSPSAIETMLASYEADHHTGMDVSAVAAHIHYYTDGYPFLVSRLCKEIHNKKLDWSVAGIDAATRTVVKENNTLFDDLAKNMQIHEKLASLIEGLLLHGDYLGFNQLNPTIQIGAMYGILKDNNGDTVIANRIFATVILNYITSVNETNKALARLSSDDISLFVKSGALDFDMIMSRFDTHMKSIYHDRESAFYEREARALFVTYLSPIINGTGYWVPEAETRGGKRMDLTIVYGKNLYIVELKIWRGEQYERDGYDQLEQYCKAKGQRVGYMLSFCDLKQKKVKGGIITRDGVEIHEQIVAYKDDV